jgi:beta-galactosidase
VFYGGDYNPEQWSEPVWREDVALMRRAGVNLVSVGVFAWSALEPARGRYEFGWLDRVLDLLAEGGVRVALATPTASPPPWFSLAHPDALTVTREGARLAHGSRDTYCVSAPAYREACARIAGELARRYAGHPALAMWHVHNEYGTGCYCDHAAAAFQNWLRGRYGDLDRLNEAWTTAFWSQRYSEWEQVLPPRATQYLSNPAQVLDFRRFLSDELLAAFREQKEVLRAATPDVPVATNFVLGGWVPVNHWHWAREVDLVAIDHYPSQAGPGAEEQTAFAADLARGWSGGKPWLLMESAPNLIYTEGRMHAKEPGRMARHSLSHVARGSQGVMFFQWRAPRGGAEQWHSAMVPHAGPDSRVYREVCELGAVLNGLSEVEDELVAADVAVLWDPEAWWALQAAHTPLADMGYLEAAQVAHRILWRAGVAVDFAHPESDLSAYRLVIVPRLYLVSDAAIRSIASYVERGGQLVVSYFSGIVDTEAQVRLGGYPGAFRDILGVRVEEFLPLAGDATVDLSTGDAGRVWSERIQPHGAETVATYVGGVLDGSPAVTCHRYGAGSAWYVSTSLDDDAYARLLADPVEEAGIRPVLAGVPDGVEVVRRGSWLFVLNHTDKPQDVASAHVPPGGVSVVGGGPRR